MIPVVPDDPFHLRAYPISNKNINAPLLVEYIIYVNEDFIYDLLPNLCQLLDQLGFKGGGTCPSTLPKAMQHVMELYCCPDLPIDNPLQHLPQHLYETETSENPIPLRNDHHRLKSTLRW